MKSKYDALLGEFRTVDESIPREEIGAAGGICPLGADGKVPAGNLPPSGDSIVYYSLFPCRAYADDTYGCVAWLDAGHSIEAAGYYGNPIGRIELFVVSANAALSGSIVLVIGGVSHVVPVTGTLAKVTVTLAAPVTGRIVITRDTTSSSDTLKEDGEAVTALVVDGRLS